MNKSLALFALAAVAQAHAGHGAAYGHSHDDASYGVRSYGQDYGYGRTTPHKSLDLDDDRRSYGGYGASGYGGYGRSSYGGYGAGGYGGYGQRYGGYAYDSDGPRQSRFDKDSDTYGHENGEHAGTELGEKTHGGDDRDYGYQVGGRGYGSDRSSYGGYGDDRQSYGGSISSPFGGYGDDRQSYGGYGRSSYGGYGDDRQSYGGYGRSSYGDRRGNYGY